MQVFLFDSGRSLAAVERGEGGPQDSVDGRSLRGVPKIRKGKRWERDREKGGLGRNESTTPASPSTRNTKHQTRISLFYTRHARDTPTHLKQPGFEPHALKISRLERGEGRPVGAAAPAATSHSNATSAAG